MQTKSQNINQKKQKKKTILKKPEITLLIIKKGIIIKKWSLAGSKYSKENI